MLELVAGPVGDEAGRDGHELRQHLQIVLPQGGARLHDVHNHIGEAQDGGQLNGAVQLDDVDVPALGGVVPLGDIPEFGGHPQGPALVLGKVFRPGHAHAAPAQARVQQLIHIRAGLGQDVLAYDADVRRAVLHVDGHVAGLHQEVADARLSVLHHQLPGVGVVFRAAVAHARQQVVNLVSQAALGQGHVQHHRASRLRRRVGQPVQLV